MAHAPLDTDIQHKAGPHHMTSASAVELCINCRLGDTYTHAPTQTVGVGERREGGSRVHTKRYTR